MPGMENLAPERTETSSGSPASPIGLAHGLLEPGAGAGHLGVERLGPAAGHVGAAGVGRDGEPGRHRELEYRRHLGQVGALATQEVLELHGRAGVRVVEIEDERHRASLPWTGEPRGERGHSEWLPLPTWDGPPQPTFLPATAPESVQRPCGGRHRRRDDPASPVTAPPTWRWKTSLAWRMKSRTMASSSALKRWATWRISSATGCCRPCRRSWAAGHDLDPDPAAVLGVAPPRHHARLLQAVEDEGHRPGGQPALLGQPARGHRAEAADKVQAAHVGPAQLQLLGQALVELAGGAEVPHDLRAQLLRQLRTRPLS